MFLFPAYPSESDRYWKILTSNFLFNFVSRYLLITNTIGNVFRKPLKFTTIVKLFTLTSIT